MTTDDFFRGFMAALKKNGLDQIETRNDRHHRAFEAVQHLAETGTTRQSRLRFIPSPYTGRFPQLDEALVRLQRDGLLRAENPYYVRVKLALSPERADKILKFYSEDDREFLRAAADAYESNQAGSQGIERGSSTA
jgi:hypothetical protein